MIAQGSNFHFSNNWWFGGEHCKYVGMNNSGANGVECLADDGNEYIFSRGATALSYVHLTNTLVHILLEATNESLSSHLDSLALVRQLSSFTINGHGKNDVAVDMETIAGLQQATVLPYGNYLKTCYDIKSGTHNFRVGLDIVSLNVITANCAKNSGGYYTNRNFTWLRGLGDGYWGKYVINDDGTLKGIKNNNDNKLIYTSGPYTFNKQGEIKSYNCVGPGCTKDLVIPEYLYIGSEAIKVKSIGEKVFYGKLLNSVTLPDSLQSIGNDAFAGNELQSITIPASVSSIGRDAFNYENGDNHRLNKVDVEGAIGRFNESWDSIFGTTDGGVSQNPEAPKEGPTPYTECTQEASSVSIVKRFPTVMTCTPNSGAISVLDNICYAGATCRGYEGGQQSSNISWPLGNPSSAKID